MRTASGPVVDTLAAEEFMREVLARVSRHDLGQVARDCARKAERLAALLGPDRAATPGRNELRVALRCVFGARRSADAIIDTVGPDRLVAEIDFLLAGDEPVASRIDRFGGVLEAFPDAAFDLPGELLHFTLPERHWLWTRWMWNPRTDTGALRLVTTEEVDLAGATQGAMYLLVGEALAVVDETGQAVGFTAFGEPSFGVDVFLACVYAIYMYTVLRMRMTQEFNRIVPALPDLVRRLLGVYHWEV